MSLLQFGKEQKEKETCFVTYGTMGHLDQAQPPSKRKPYSSILSMPFVSKTEFILPQSSYDAFKELLDMQQPSYSRVTMPLSGILEGDFFTEYVKKGNVLMLSEGVHGVDNVFSLREGMLTLALDKESYERAGLVGRPDGSTGSRRSRLRWVVEINLRLPSMLHGKKGFDRIAYGMKQVLDKPVTWLFCNVGCEAPSPDPLENYHPVKTGVEAVVSQSSSVQVPHLQPPASLSIEAVDDFGEFATDLYEWISLVQLESPRVAVNDHIDPFLSRYTIPETTSDGRPENLVRLSWSGFLPSSWVHGTFVEALVAAPAKSWYTCSVTGFQSSLPAGARDCTILAIPGSSPEFLLWEIERN